MAVGSNVQRLAVVPDVALKCVGPWPSGNTSGDASTRLNSEVFS
jgi:hypothetical protein